MPTLLLSDIHLEPTDEGQARIADFATFLREIDATRIERLIVLGDLFDFWFEYKYVIFSGYFDVLCAFADLRRRGLRLDLVCGNHDFWAGRFLRDHLGFVVHQAPFFDDFGGRRVLLTHGDGLNPKDWGYRIYKRIARARPVIALFRFIHPDGAMAIARGVSRTSRRLLEAEDLDAGPETLAIRDFARKTLLRGEADVVVSGHSHCPAIEEYPTPGGIGLYVNPGDWLHHRSYVEWDGETFRLHEAP